MTKEQVAGFIKQYADNCGVQAIKDSLGTNGSSWQSPYDQGVYAVCEGVSAAVNQEVASEIILRTSRDEQVRGKLNELVASYMQLLSSYRFYHPGETGAPDVQPLNWS